MRAVLKDAAAAFHTCDFYMLFGEPLPHIHLELMAGSEDTFFKARLRLSKALEMVRGLGMAGERNTMMSRGMASWCT